MTFWMCFELFRLVAFDVARVSFIEILVKLCDLKERHKSGGVSMCTAVSVIC